MSTKADKFLAKQELEKRKIEQGVKHKKYIERMTDDELQELLDEPDESDESEDNPS